MYLSMTQSFPHMSARIWSQLVVTLALVLRSFLNVGAYESRGTAALNYDARDAACRERSRTPNAR